MPRDAAATRSRLLEAAIEEFSAHGLAGARVDRIAATARANKRAIYDHFGDKDGLFRAATRATIDRLNAAVPWAPDDLPDYVGRLFDHHREHPESIRMATWVTLEGRGLTDGGDVDVYRDFVASLAGRAGEDDAIPAADLAVLILAMAPAWQLANAELRAVAGDDEERTARHRAALVEAVRRMTRP